MIIKEYCLDELKDYYEERKDEVIGCGGHPLSKEELEKAAIIYQKNEEDYNMDSTEAMVDALEEVSGCRFPEPDGFDEMEDYQISESDAIEEVLDSDLFDTEEGE